MTTKTWIVALIAAFLPLAPLAAAQDEKPQDDPQSGGNAWVEDCPPDMMCAMQEPAPEEPSRGPADGSCEYCRGGEGGDAPTYPADCGGEVCASDTPVDNGSAEGEIPYEDGSNCMDGEQEGETCRDDVYYMTPPKDDAPQGGSEGGAEADPVSAPAGSEGGITSAKEESRKATPALGLGLAVAALGAVALVAARRR